MKNEELKNKKKTFVYLYYALYNRLDEVITQVDGICLSFGKIINNNGLFEVDVKHLIPIIDDLKRMDDTPNLILSIGGWGADGFSRAVEDDAKRSHFISSIINVLDEFHFSGVDIDWEYPTTSSGGINSNGEVDKHRFTLLLKEIKEQFESKNKKYTLSIACSMSPKFYEVKEINNYIDYLNLMSYDLDYGTNINVHLTSPHHSSNTLMDLETGVKAFIESGISSEKIIVGCAMYARKCKTKNITTGISNEHTEFNTIKYSDMENLIKSGKVTVLFDYVAMAEYAIDIEYFYSFDSVKSINEKVKFVKQNNLGGIMAWEYNQDSKEHVLLKEMLKVGD